MGYNVMFSQHGHMTLAHMDRSVNSLRERAERNQILSVGSSLIWLDEIKRLVPTLDVSDWPRYPIDSTPDFLFLLSTLKINIMISLIPA